MRPEAIGRLARQDQVLEEAEARHQHELLVDHADAAGEGVGRSEEGNRSVVDQHLALVRSVHPLQDAHQRRFAGAVAADDGVH